MDTTTHYFAVDVAADRLMEIWGRDFDQVEAHLDSDGFTDDEVAHALDRMRDMP